MQITKARGVELVERWIHQNKRIGKTLDQLKETTFVYGNEILTLNSTERGMLNIDSKKSNVVIFRKIDELDMTNTCRACGVEHQSHKDAIECCVDITE